MGPPFLLHFETGDFLENFANQNKHDFLRHLRKMQKPVLGKSRELPMRYSTFLNVHTVTCAKYCPDWFIDLCYSFLM